MELLLFHVLVWGQTEDTIGIVSETLRFVKSQELEEGAFVCFDISLELVWGNLLIALKGLDASIVLPYETLKLGRSVGKLGGSLGEDLV